MEHIEIKMHIQWYEKTSFSLLKDLSQLVIYTAIQSRISRTAYPAPWCLGRMLIFARYTLRLRIQ